MDCRTCGAALTEGARFCAACGAPAGGACSSCAAVLPEGARFCPVCGTSVTQLVPVGAPIAAEPPASGITLASPRDPGRERKVATLLFADIVDFTGLAERNDPELVSGLVSNAFERLSSEIERYQGTIEKFAGDAMLAVFGAPAAHEDDPERAVRAALEMQSVMAASRADGGAAPELRLRIGIETGEVLVDRARAANERDLFVTGDAVNIAARLQGAAAAGAVVVGPSTYAATREAIDYAELDSMELKGKSAPVLGWRAVAVRAGRGGRRSRLGLESPMVGRDTELTLLKETVRRTVDDERPHLVTVIGSAGVGKSRLTWELEKYLDGLPATFHWRKGRCLAYSGRSFEPIAEVAKVDAHILDDDSPTVARAKLAARLGELELDDDEADVRDAIEAVLAIGDGRERPREELFEAWRRYLGAIARLAPLVLIVEDIHWADDGVLAFLDFLARWGEGSMVIICLARHELLERSSSWGGGLRNASTIVLEPLGPEASSALLAGLLDGGIPQVLGERIIGLSEGNPLFAEEMVRMLVDRGALRFADGRWHLATPVDEVEIPGSVHAVLAARLDALPRHEKRVAQDASVVGRIFWDQLVAHLSRDDIGTIGDRLRRLRVKDLIVPREPSALAGTSEFGFRHVLIRDVAYDSLPKRDRATLHREIAQWAEVELADRVEEFGELIASHLVAAVSYEEEFDVDQGPELRELRRLAHVAALRASRRAWSMSQVGEAARWLGLAIELAWKIGLPVREIAALSLEYRESAYMAGSGGEQVDIATRVLDALLVLPDRTPEDELVVARLRGMLGNGLFHENDVEGSRAVLRLALDELGDEPRPEVRGYLHAVLGWTYWRAGPVEEAVPILEAAVSEAREAGDDHTLRWATHDLGTALGMQGDYDAAVAAVEESMGLAQEAEDRNLVMRCYINIPAIRAARGDDIRPLAKMAEEGIGRARRAAAGGSICWLSGNLAGFMTDLGRLDEAIAYQDESVRTAEVHVPGNLRTMLVDRATLHRLRGEFEAAERDEASAARIDIGPELQVALEHIRNRAIVTWQEDPGAALELCIAAMNDESLSDDSRAEIAHAAARGALRLGDERRLAEAAGLDRHGRDHGSPSRDVRRDWGDGLVDGTDGATVEAAAEQMERLGLLVPAVDAWADAALLAARAGRSSEAQLNATTLAGRIGMYPLLGPLPETRWIRPAAGRPDGAVIG